MYDATACVASVCASVLGRVYGARVVLLVGSGNNGVLSTIGKVTLAGVPLDLRLASLGNLAQVVSTNATADKTLSIGDLSLPSVNDLLAGLGLDISKLTQDQLTQLAGVVGTVSSAISTLNTQIDTLQTQVAGAPATIAAGAAAVTTTTNALQTQLDALNAALQDPTTGAATTGLLTTALTTAGLTLPTVPITLPAWSAFTAALQSAIAAFSDGTLSTTIAAANTALDQAQQLVTDLTNLLGLVTGALDADPIASLGGVKLTTKAVAARTPNAVSTLSVASVDVLGQASALSAVSGAVATVGSTLASVLNSVPGVTFVPPSISVGVVVGHLGHGQPGIVLRHHHGELCTGIGGERRVGHGDHQGDPGPAGDPVRQRFGHRCDVDASHPRPQRRRAPARASGRSQCLGLARAGSADRERAVDAFGLAHLDLDLGVAGAEWRPAAR